MEKLYNKYIYFNKYFVFRMVDSQYASTAGMFAAASLITGIFTGILFSMAMPFLVANMTF